MATETMATKTDTGPIEPNTVAELGPGGVPQNGGGTSEAAQPTAPVSVRPRPRGPRGGSLTRMGPWAPAAGALVGLLLGVVAVLFVAPVADVFTQRLALVFLVGGCGLLGAALTLLADEVQLMRRGGRPAPGITPGRLLVLAGAFVLLLSTLVAG